MPAFLSPLWKQVRQAVCFGMVPAAMLAFAKAQAENVGAPPATTVASAVAIETEKTPYPIKVFGSDEASRNVLFVAGHSRGAWTQEAVTLVVDTFQHHGARVVEVGDVNASIDLDDVSRAIDVARKNGKPTMVFVFVHGDEGFDADKKRRHILGLSQDEPIETRAFFSLLSKKFGSDPVEVMMVSCHGGAALPDFSGMPLGSSLMVMSDMGQETPGPNVEAFLKALKNKAPNSEALTTHSLLLDYLLADMQERTRPSLLRSGGGWQLLGASLVEHSGRDFSMEERENVYAGLEDRVPREKLDEMMKTIEDSNNLMAIPEAEFGLALAVALTADSTNASLTFREPQNPEDRKTILQNFGMQLLKKRGVEVPETPTP